MVKIDRSTPPENFEIKESNLRSPAVFDVLVKDCQDKCYICEQKEFTGGQIEHIIPHQDNPDLKYDWNNLLFSCPHCNKNSVKSTRRIINCTETDPEKLVELRYINKTLENEEKVIISKTEYAEKNNAELYETIDILKRTYYCNDKT